MSNIPKTLLYTKNTIFVIINTSPPWQRERINNADNSFAVFEQRSYNKILLIDDAIGSGATINQIARKLKTQGVCKEIIGLAIVGSFKGFDVITDV